MYSYDTSYYPYNELFSDQDYISFDNMELRLVHKEDGSLGVVKIYEVIYSD